MALLAAGQRRKRSRRRRYRVRTLRLRLAEAMLDVPCVAVRYRPVPRRFEEADAAGGGRLTVRKLAVVVRGPIGPRCGRQPEADPDRRTVELVLRSVDGR